MVPDGLEAFEKLDEVTPSPGTGRSARSGHGVAGSPSASASTASTRPSASSPTTGQSGYLDFESAKPEKLDPEIVEMFDDVDAKAGDAMVVYGWTMAEDLVKLGQR